MVNDQEEIIVQEREPKSVFQSFKQWFSARWNSMQQRESKFIFVWTIFFIASLGLEWLTVIPGLPTGLGLIADYFIFGIIYIIAIAAAQFVIRYVLAFFYMQRVASLIASLALLITQSLILMLRVNWGWKVSIIMTALVVLSTALLGLMVAYLYVYKRKSISFIAAILGILCIVVTVVFELRGLTNKQQRAELIEKYENVLLSDRTTKSDQAEDSVSSDSDHDGGYTDDSTSDESEQVLWKLDSLDSNPAEAGNYEVRHLYYKSVDEPDQNKENDYIYTRPMDGSSVLKDWSWTKQLYWGFSEDAIPMNGQLWVPEGEGPFPIVFIMHGNHLSEEDSSDGYAYLGQLLASHGMIVSSIDANFLNYSVWSGIVDDDQLLRSWLMLAHATSFYELESEQLNVDWDQVAFIGHSRGGQAAAMAVDAKKWMADQEIVSILDKINVRAVVGIAPTDYRVDSKQANLRNVNYLTLHGTMDADLIESYGDRQYERTSFSEADHFKATVELYHANHGQFNTVWGKYDEQFPGGLMLNTAELMKGDDQREAAKLFINSFLLASLKGEKQYEAVFQDFRTAGEFLPLTGYVTRYKNSATSYWYDFERNIETKQWSSSEMLEAQVLTLKGRGEGLKQNNGLHIQWLGENQQISFELTNHQRYMMNQNVEALTLSVAQAEYALVNEQEEAANNEVEAKEQSTNSSASQQATNNEEELDEITQQKVDAALDYLSEEGLLEESSDNQLEQLEQFIDQSLLEQGYDLPIELTLISSEWGELTFDVSAYFHLLSPVENDFTKLGALEGEIKKGKYDVALEPLLQSYIIPLNLLGEEVEQLDFTTLETITLTFKTTVGSLIIDNIGVVTEGGTYVSYSK